MFGNGSSEFFFLNWYYQQIQPNYYWSQFNQLPPAIERFDNFQQTRPNQQEIQVKSKRENISNKSNKIRKIHDKEHLRSKKRRECKKQKDYLAKQQKKGRNVNSNILKSFLRYCLKICQKNNQLNQHITTTPSQFQFQLKKRINLSTQYVKVSQFTNLYKQQTQFSKTLRIYFHRFSRIDCRLILINSNRLKRQQKILHLKNRISLISKINSY